MLTIGKSNYLRFNNPAEAQLIRSTMGSNERISMPQIDFTQNSNSSSSEGTPEEVFKNLNSFLESQNHMAAIKNENSKIFLDQMTKIDYSNIKNFHSPKVFAADSITVNTPAQAVLGAKFNNFTKNLPQNSINYSQNSPSDKNNGVAVQNNYVNVSSVFGGENSSVLTKVNNLGSCSKSPQSPASYDRYPKPGSYGSLQIFPMNGVNSQINGDLEISSETHRQKAHLERMREQEISLMEQERLEEILKMCSDYERQNQSITSSPIVQNRIKTNGSLPRDKKSPFCEKNPNVFFPNDSGDRNGYKKPNSGYENVAILHDRRMEQQQQQPTSGRYENVDSIHQIDGQNNHQKSSNGYENVFNAKKYTPQSPRTRIKTCVSPKKETIDKRNEYDELIHTFEEKLRAEIKILRENKSYDENLNGNAEKNQKNLDFNVNCLGSDGSSGSNGTNGYNLIEDGSHKIRDRNVNKLTVNINKKIDEKLLFELNKKRVQILMKIREGKTQIAELQRQGEEVHREVSLLDFIFLMILSACDIG